MADETASSDGSGAAAADDGTQSFAPSALSSGVKLQPGTSIKITVIGVSGKPLSSGRKPRHIDPPSGLGSGDADNADTSPADAGGSNSSATVEADPDDENIHVLVAEVHGADGSLLAGHGVRVYTADGGKLIGQGTTDENGVLNFDVPIEGDYNLELVDEPLAANISGEPGGNDPVHVLRAIFTDASGAALAGEKVSVTIDGKDGFELTCDASGMAETSGPLRSYELTVRGTKFIAHSLPAADHASADNTFRFTVDAKKGAA